MNSKSKLLVQQEFSTKQSKKKSKAAPSWKLLEENGSKVYSSKDYCVVLEDLSQPLYFSFQESQPSEKGFAFLPQ